MRRFSNLLFVGEQGHVAGKLDGLSTNRVAGVEQGK
jgi:hypothetical protein